MHFINHRISKFPLIRVLIISAAALPLSSCVGVGGNQLSLLPTTQILDPLEVPPTLSPLPEAQQLKVPDEIDVASLDLESVSPEQFRNYESWVAFEEFRKFQRQDSGIGVDYDEYEATRRRGEGMFKVTTFVTSSGNKPTVRMRIVDNMDSAWNRIARVLRDLNVKIVDADEETRVFKVADVPVKNLPNLAERMGISEYAGIIEQLHVIARSDTDLEVIAKTNFDVEVNQDGSEEFFKRLRYYLLTQYTLNPDSVGDNEVEFVHKKLVPGEEGVGRIVISEKFEDVWVRIGRTLKASGLYINDLDRSKGVYRVSYSAKTDEESKKGFFAKLKFWDRKSGTLSQEEFLVHVKQAGEETEVWVESTSTGEDKIQLSEGLLQILYERLRV